MRRVCTTPATFTWSQPNYGRLAALENISCPALISRYSAYVRTAQARKLECCSTDTQQNTLARLRFQTCDGTFISAHALISLLRNRTIAFVGDSTLHQLYEAFVFDLRASALPFTTLFRDAERESKPDNFDDQQGCITATGKRGVSKPGGSELRFQWRWDGSLEHCSVISWAQKTLHWAKCSNLPDEELHLAHTNTRLLWFRTNGNFSTNKQGRSFRLGASTYQYPISSHSVVFG